jgi:hypothetical protein
MAFSLTFTTRASPADVLDAIKHRAAYWQESQTPLPLRAAGVLRVRAELRGQNFALDLGTMGLRGRGISYASLSGQVTFREACTVVEARVGLPKAFRRYPFGLLVMAALFLWKGTAPIPSAALFVVMSMLVYASHRAWDARISRENDPGGRFLAERLETAMASLPQVEPTTAPSDERRS